MSNLVTRVQNILLTPRTEWPVIAAEPETTAGLYTRYILIVSALGPIAMFLKSTLIGTSIPFMGTFRMGMGAGLTMAVLSYVLGLVGIFLFAWVINALAPAMPPQSASRIAISAVAEASWVLALEIAESTPASRIVCASTGVCSTMNRRSSRVTGMSR